MKPVDLEEKLWNRLRKATATTFELREKYVYQYKTKTKGIIKINAMCFIHEGDDLHKEFICVNDVGSWYFEVSYDFTSGLFEGVYVNGEA